MTAAAPLADIQTALQCPGMSARLIVVLMLTLCWGCGHRTASEDKREPQAPPPQICERVKDEKSAARCLTANAPRGETEATLTCFPFSEPQYLSGIWVTGLESSTFFEGAKTFESSMLFEGGDTWLTPDAARPETTRSMQGEATRAYQVELIGRRSLCPGYYGHLGVYRQEVRVERFMALRSVPALINGHSAKKADVR
jgi:hypothetical protein